MKKFGSFLLALLLCGVILAAVSAPAGFGEAGNGTAEKTVQTESGETETK